LNKKDTRKNRKSKPVREIVHRLLDFGYASNRVNYLIISFDYCVLKGALDVEDLIDNLIDVIPSDSNLVMNTFTWKFCSGDNYHSLNSRCEVGLINDLFRRRNGVVRSNHPIYSYAFLGPDAEDLALQNCQTCWGEGSVTLRLLRRDDVHVVTYGLLPLSGSLLRANPSLHALEERFKVPYRYFKTFKGMVDFGSGYHPYLTKMYVRPLNTPFENTWRPLSEILEARKLAVYNQTDRIYSYMNNDLFHIGIELLSENINAFLMAC
jgi:aminoglycoside N3'-acetyltransferase